MEQVRIEQLKQLHKKGNSDPSRVNDGWRRQLPALPVSFFTFGLSISLFFFVFHVISLVLSFFVCFSSPVPLSLLCHVGSLWAHLTLNCISQTPFPSPTQPPSQKSLLIFTSPLAGLQFIEGWGRARPPSGWGGLVFSSVGFPSHHRRGRQLSGSRLSSPSQKALCRYGCLKATFGQKG